MGVLVGIGVPGPTVGPGVGVGTAITQPKTKLVPALLVHAIEPAGHVHEDVGKQVEKLEHDEVIRQAVFGLPSAAQVGIPAGVGVGVEARSQALSPGLQTSPAQHGIKKHDAFSPAQLGVGVGGVKTHAPLLQVEPTGQPLPPTDTQELPLHVY